MNWVLGECVGFLVGVAEADIRDIWKSYRLGRRAKITSNYTKKRDRLIPNKVHESVYFNKKTMAPGGKCSISSPYLLELTGVKYTTLP